MANDKIGYFNLSTDGASAVVRILHTGVDTIESVDTHWIESAEGNKKCVKCLGAGCPVCATAAMTTNRIYIHLYDYTDGTDKVWARTDKILSQLKEVQDAWGKLCDCVVKITRVGTNFPKYTMTVQNSKMFVDVNPELINKNIAYRFYMTRSADELKEFLTTGVMPVHKSNFVPKDEYFKAKETDSNSTYAQKAGTFNAQPKPQSKFPSNNTMHQENTTPPVKKTSNEGVFSDPFLVKPSRRV